MNHSSMTSKIKAVKSIKADVIAGLALFVLAACFSVSLGSAALGYDNFGALFGQMILDAYGFCAALIPLFLLAAGAVCFMGNWTASRAMRLLTACVPFFTLVATESTCRSIFALGTDAFTSAKISVTVALGVMLVIIEYLGAGIIGEHISMGKSRSKVYDADGEDGTDNAQGANVAAQKAFRNTGKGYSSGTHIGTLHGLDKEDDMLDELDTDTLGTGNEHGEEDGEEHGDKQDEERDGKQDEEHSGESKETEEQMSTPRPSPFDGVFDENGNARDGAKDIKESKENATAPLANDEEEAGMRAGGAVITEEEYNALTRDDPAEISWDNMPSSLSDELSDATADAADETLSDEELQTLEGDVKAEEKAEYSEKKNDEAIAPSALEDDAISENGALDGGEKQGEQAAELDEDFFDIDINDPDTDTDETEDYLDDGGVAEYSEPGSEGSETAGYTIADDTEKAAGDDEASGAAFGEETAAADSGAGDKETSKEQCVEKRSTAEVFAQMDADIREELGIKSGEAAHSEGDAETKDCREPLRSDTPPCGGYSTASGSPNDEAAVDSEGDSDGGADADFSPVPHIIPDEIDAAVAPIPLVEHRMSSRPFRAYTVPTSLLTKYDGDEYWVIDAGTQRASATLKETLGEFHIEAEVVGIRKGPVVTMFELLPAPGVKLSKIVALQDNIALRLAASSVRIVAPIPGKKAVGIEIPNRKRSLVDFREIIEQDAAEFKSMAVPVILGKDILGHPQIIDLVKTPHLLIAGATGAGKSVCVNSMILSILYKRSPDEVKLILIDPKVVELKLYNDIPHLLVPVITETKKALQALQWALCEMERRYAMLDRMGCREIASYNRKIVEKNIAAEKMPYIIIIIDEFADLMATSGKELESTVARLAAMSRAVGIHLALATQRPSIDVITGLIKANIPSRIAFMVASKTDSRIIIDQVGAEKLLGKGDMLYASAVDPYPTRIQGTFVSDQEVENVVEYIKQYDTPDYIEDEVFVGDDDEGDSDPSEFGEGEDPLYDEALNIVMQAGKASASYIQRRLKIGYNRAARLVEDMETRGIVGPANGSKPREIVHVP